MKPATHTRPHGIKCGNCKNAHRTVAAVRRCYDTTKAIWQIPAAFGFLTTGWEGFRVLSMDEAIAENEAFADQQAAEIWAENAWLRAAEAGDPASWREEELARMAEASGVPVPPGYF